MDSINNDLDHDHWTALCQLADTVNAYRALPEDAPKDALNEYLERLQVEYVAAYERLQAGLLAT